VQTGTGLFRSHRRSAPSFASTMSGLADHPRAPSPPARQTHAEASLGASARNEAVRRAKKTESRNMFLLRLKIFNYAP
jgi:hypothetical protein